MMNINSDPQKIKIIAIIVTYNRANLIEKALESILNQTFPVYKIILINNNSSDNTENLIKEKYNINSILYYKMGKNLGGAGGFNAGIKEASKLSADYYWLIDDDAEAHKDALYSLIKKLDVNESISFLCSNVINEDGDMMNTPEVDQRPQINGYPSWNKYLKKGMLKVRTSTFVSILINRKSIEAVGLPIKDMFIWGDDGEYTYRLSNHGNSYLVGESIVVHKRDNKNKIDILKENNENRIKNYFYYYRNNIFISKKYKNTYSTIRFMAKAFIYLIKCLILLKPLHFFVISKGIVSGIFFNPKIEKI